MATYLSPGVYVEEIASGSAPIAGVGTSTAGFIGVINVGIKESDKDESNLAEELEAIFGEESKPKQISAEKVSSGQGYDLPIDDLPAGIKITKIDIEKLYLKKGENDYSEISVDKYTTSIDDNKPYVKLGTGISGISTNEGILGIYKLQYSLEEPSDIPPDATKIALVSPSSTKAKYVLKFTADQNKTHYRILEKILGADLGTIETIKDATKDSPVSLKLSSPVGKGSSLMTIEVGGESLKKEDFALEANAPPDQALKFLQG